MVKYYYDVGDVESLSRQTNKEKSIRYFKLAGEIKFIEGQFNKPIEKVTRRELAWWIIQTQGRSKSRIRKRFM